MTEEDRVKFINEASAAHLEDWLQQLENDEVTEDDLLASLYGSMVAAYLLGYNLENMYADAKAGGERLMKAFEEHEDRLPRVCPNKDEDGNCPLHNLHCQYPDCEKDQLTNEKN